MRLAEITKDEFHQRLVDPRKAEVERKLREWDDILRNRFKWRAEWGDWCPVRDMIEVTAYRARTLPVSTDSVEDIRQTVWTFFIQNNWDRDNDVEILHEHEDEDSIVYEFYLEHWAPSKP